MFPYHAWLRLHELHDWEKDYRGTFTGDHKGTSILKQLNLVPEKHRRIFFEDLQQKDIYEDDVISMLKFPKNLIMHINDHLYNQFILQYALSVEGLISK